MRIRTTLLAIAFGLFAAASAQAASCPQTITGPQDASQLPATITGLLNSGSCPVSTLGASPRNVDTCNFVPDPATSAVTDQTPVATEVYIAEIYVPTTMTVQGVALFNGSVASGNVKAGLADVNGNVVATSASTAMSGTATYQRVPFTANYTAVGPATYYVLSFVDNNTARMSALTYGNCGAAKQTAQTYATGFTKITPPTTFTTALGPVASLY